MARDRSWNVDRYATVIWWLQIGYGEDRGRALGEKCGLKAQAQ